MTVWKGRLECGKGNTIMEKITYIGVGKLMGMQIHFHMHQYHTISYIFNKGHLYIFHSCYSFNLFTVFLFIQIHFLMSLQISPLDQFQEPFYFHFWIITNYSIMLLVLPHFLHFLALFSSYLLFFSTSPSHSQKTRE